MKKHKADHISNEVYKTLACLDLLERGSTDKSIEKLQRELMRMNLDMLLIYVNDLRND